MSDVDPRDAKIAELTALMEKLVARVGELEAEVARLKRNSSNSSKPPSSDLPGLPRSAPKQPTGKPRGGQSGHKRSMRALVPVEQVNDVVVLVPEICVGCGGHLVGCDTEPHRHQVVEIPPVTPHITEYQRHALSCSACGTMTRAPLPAGVPAGAFGPRLTALVAIFSAKYRLSKRAVRACLSDVLGVTLSLGAICKAERQVSRALAAPVADACTHVQSAAVIHADETSWREAKSKAWLWVAATAFVTVFRIAKKRGSVVAKTLIGSAFAGTLVTDRWPAYAWVAARQRQVCWAHLKRDFQSWVDGGTSAGKRFGEALLVQIKEMFRLWHLARDGTMSRLEFQAAMADIQTEVVTILEDASRCNTRAVTGMAKQILKLGDALWSFVDTEGVEPTNNFGERQIRHAVMWRKTSFGTDSENGSRFVERMLTVSTTLRQQGRNVLEFVTLACAAELNRAEHPSLIP